MTNKQQNAINNFFQIFTDSTAKTLLGSLDNDVCKKINFQVTSSSQEKDVESLKESNVIFKIDYATGRFNAAMIVLLPEELVAAIANIIMGGNGTDAYKGSLSELETNSILKLSHNVFRNIEAEFKHHYNKDLVFSTKPSIFLKETPDYQINSADFSYNFAVNNILSLNDEEYKISLLLNSNELDKLLNDLGLLSKTASPGKKNINASLDFKCLEDVQIHVTAELGRTQVPIKYALELVRGSIIELDTLNNSDIKVFANGVEFAQAQVVAVEDNFGLKITKIIRPEERMGTV